MATIPQRVRSKSWVTMKIIELEEVDSTNEYCKRLGGGDVIVTALKQTGGKGTKGRSFVSDGGGLYLSIMRELKNLTADRAFTIMVNSCVAVCKTLSPFGLQPVIRWANDVLVGGKKICGTLIENTFSGGKISRSIVGIGINVNNKLPTELEDIATTMKSVLHSETPLKAVRDELIKNFGVEYSVEDYKSYINWFGKKVTLKTQDGQREVTALDVDGTGRLIVESSGEVQKISAAEVSLRI